MIRRGWRRLLQGLARTRAGLAAVVAGSGAAPPEEWLERLSEALLAADVGPARVDRLVELLRERARREGLDAAGLRAALRCELCALVGDSPHEPARGRPHVVFVVGVNGSGKTTTVGKLAARERAEGRRVVVAAADTFRAAAIEQLQRWAERAGAQLVKHREGADAAAVIFDALRAAKARGADTVLADTAGRLHTKRHLMAELEKLVRVAGREVPGAPHEVLLVLDATTGQNALAQAREFSRIAPLTGLVLAKLDGTAKGGAALAIREELGLPIRYVGVGEAEEDLVPFDAQTFVGALLGEGEGEGEAA